VCNVVKCQSVSMRLGKREVSVRTDSSPTAPCIAEDGPSLQETRSEFFWIHFGIYAGIVMEYVME
jgi:hypothetical protein